MLTINILFNPRMMPKILKEWGSLKVRRYFRKLTGQPRPESVIVKELNGHACINGAIQEHNQKVLNGIPQPGAGADDYSSSTSAPS